MTRILAVIRQARLTRDMTQLTEAEFAAFITCAAVVIGLALVPLAIVLMEMI